MPRIARIVIPHYPHHVLSSATVAKEFSLMMKIIFYIKIYVRGSLGLNGKCS